MTDALCEPICSCRRPRSGVAVWMATAFEAAMPLISWKRFGAGNGRESISPRRAKRPEASELRRIAATPKTAVSGTRESGGESRPRPVSGGQIGDAGRLSERGAGDTFPFADAGRRHYWRMNWPLIAAFRGDKSAAAFAAESLDAFLTTATGWRAALRDGKTRGMRQRENRLSAATDVVRKERSAFPL